MPHIHDACFTLRRHFLLLLAIAINAFIFITLYAILLFWLRYAFSPLLGLRQLPFSFYCVTIIFVRLCCQALCHYFQLWFYICMRCYVSEVAFIVAAAIFSCHFAAVTPVAAFAMPQACWRFAARLSYARYWLLSHVVIAGDTCHFSQTYTTTFSPLAFIAASFFIICHFERCYAFTPHIFR